MSSHREAPEMSKDPVADSTDVYAFVSPDRPDTVTLIANYIPFQAPDGGPNFYEFGDDVAYDINISNSGQGEADIIYRFRFHDRRCATTRRSSTTPARSRHRRHHVEPPAVLLGDPGQERPARKVLGPTSRARRSTSARAARRTTPTSPAAVHKSAAARSSPASGPTRSTSTSAASSTSARCARSRACT